MQLPLQITFRNVPHSRAIESKINQRVIKLQRFCDRITNCRVLLEIPHHHHRKGNTYHLRIDLTLPHEKLIINRDTSQQSPENIYAAINDAFDVAQRKLKRYKHSVLQKA